MKMRWRYSILHFSNPQDKVMQHIALASKPFNTSATKKKFQKDLEDSDSP
jgi:hypothetical protein